MNEKFESHHYSIKDLKYVPKAVHAWFHKMICDTFPSTFLFSGIAKKSEKRKDSWYAETNDDYWDGDVWDGAKNFLDKNKGKLVMLRRQF